jgi:hypothetical protein
MSRFKSFKVEYKTSLSLMEQGNLSQVNLRYVMTEMCRSVGEGLDKHS